MDNYSFYKNVCYAISKDKKIALCYIVATHGSTPLKAGAKMMVYEDGKIVGTIGGGALEKKVIENAIECMNKAESKLFTHELLKEHNMCCGGTVELFIECILPKKKLLIFGAGHVGKTLAKYASSFDFNVTIIDDRKDIVNDLKNRKINIFNDNPINFFKENNIDKNTFIVIATYSHDLDREILFNCLNYNYSYIGMIGSKRKALVTKSIFLKKGINIDSLPVKIDMPIGYDIGAKNPEELAIAILAKLIKIKNKNLKQMDDNKYDFKNLMECINEQL